MKPPRQIAVVSGKGGTGKTTVTASLAILSAPLVLADADVEASNLSLVFPGELRAVEPFPGMPLAVIDQARCTACGICVEVCRFDAVSVLDPAVDIPTIDSLACEGCGVCVDACPAGAIIEEPSLAGELFVNQSRLGVVVSARLEPGEDLSGRLTTLVRQRAMAEAETEHIDLVLIDGPPGTGCPTIATIAGVDALIAVTEPTGAGTADLLRLTELAGRFDLVPDVIINKADLSSSGAAALEAECGRLGIKILAKLPFVSGLPRWLEKGAQLEELPEALQPLRSVAERLRL